MHVYLYQAEGQSQQWLNDLRAERMTPTQIKPQFFRGDLRLLNRDGHEAHAFLLVANPDLITQILQLRRAGIANPILVLRPERDADNAAQALDAGADDDVVMPVRALELKARINAVLRRAHGHAADSITVGEVTAFFDGRDPEVDGQRVKLSRREHKVFQQLVLNARKVTSKAAIYDAVYGMSDDQPFDKVIDVYICKIRKKIGQAAASGHPYIETVHGRGYKFDEADIRLAPVAAE
ncbi:response regulator transcription factor [Seohaeicola zhoushanensis]|uniref:Transcriptional regulator n=1 Tax=Seohaeicola zhoushanensis TaxID=1569283 RepID=A0A8J3GTS6_9RHOB|nr:response regulator transcription factor [Seohaeicola zhoushanensis]GHF36272.1 hypothetical protein GCM10017056_05110 [Seohaeicola zhoushanensis]